MRGIQFLKIYLVWDGAEILKSGIIIISGYQTRENFDLQKIIILKQVEIYFTIG